MYCESYIILNKVIPKGLEELSKNSEDTVSNVAIDEAAGDEVELFEEDFERGVGDAVVEALADCADRLILSAKDRGFETGVTIEGVGEGANVDVDVAVGVGVGVGVEVDLDDSCTRAEIPFCGGKLVVEGGVALSDLLAIDDFGCVVWIFLETIWGVTVDFVIHGNGCSCCCCCFGSVLGVADDTGALGASISLWALFCIEDGGGEGAFLLIVRWLRVFWIDCGVL